MFVQRGDPEVDLEPGPEIRTISSVGSTLWALIVAAFVTVEGGEAIVIQDGSQFNIVNNTAPNARVHVIVSEHSRFILRLLIEPTERQGTLKLDYLERVNNKELGSLTLQNDEEVLFASSRIDFAGKTVPVAATYTLPDGRVLINATLIITPFSYTGNTICSTHWDCRAFSSNCTGGYCLCGPEYKFDKREKFCSKACKTKADCAYFRDSECFLKRCACPSSRKAGTGECAFAKGCTDDSSCPRGAFCESTKCVCPTGTVSTQGGCMRLPCVHNSNCSFWMHTECGRISPGSRTTGCRCAEGTALLMGSCNPTDHLGPCPYGRCIIEYSHCDSTTRTCQCNPGYQLRIYGASWVCEKQDIASEERSCKDAEQCFVGEECVDEICKCPKKQELEGTRCVEIKVREPQSNLLMIIFWLSAVMLALIVTFASFGCCLYLLAQRAENEQMAIVRMFEGTEEEEEVV